MYQYARLQSKSSQRDFMENMSTNVADAMEVDAVVDATTADAKVDAESMKMEDAAVTERETADVAVTKR